MWRLPGGVWLVISHYRTSANISHQSKESSTATVLTRTDRVLMFSVRCSRAAAVHTHRWLHLHTTADRRRQLVRWCRSLFASAAVSTSTLSSTPPASLWTNVWSTSSQQRIYANIWILCCGVVSYIVSSRYNFCLPAFDECWCCLVFVGSEYNQSA